MNENPLNLPEYYKTQCVKVGCGKWAYPYKIESDSLFKVLCAYYECPTGHTKWAIPIERIERSKS